MKKNLCLLLCVSAMLWSGCNSTPKLDTNGQPPPGYKVVPVVPPAF